MKSRSFLIIVLVYFFIGIGNNLIHPITTPFIQDYLKIDTSYFGVYFSLMSLGQVVGAILCGILSKKIKLKYLLIIGTIGYAFFQLLFGFVNFNPNIVILWRFFAGLFISLPNTLILVFGLNNIAKEDRVRGLSLLASANILGIAVGYEIGGLLHDYVFLDNYHLSFVVQGVWCIFTAIFTLIFVKNIISNDNQKGNNYFKVLKNMKFNKKIFFFSFVLSSLATIIVSKFFEPFFQNIANQRFSSSDLAHVVLLTSVIGIIANLIFIPIIKSKKNLKTDLLFMILLFVSSVLIFVIFSQTNEEFLILFIFSLYFIYSMIRYLIVPIEQNIAVKGVENDEVTSYISLRQAILSFAQVLGPLMMTSVFSNNMMFPFIIASILFLIAGFLMIIVCFRKEKNT